MARGDVELACLGFVRSCPWCCYKETRPGFTDLLYSVIPNPDLNAFPDFVADGDRYIEHFRVSAYPERPRKGSALRRFKAEMKFDADRLLAFLRTSTAGFQDSFHFDHAIVHMPEMYASYCVFFDSFRRNFEKHIDSGRSVYASGHDTNAFLVDMSNCRMMARSGSGDVFRYCVYQDARLLKYLLGFIKDVDFIVFVDGEYVQPLFLHNTSQFWILRTFR